MDDRDKIADRIKDLTGWVSTGGLKIVTDTTEWMDIYRGQVMLLGDHHFLVKGNPCETRFGIKDQPKYWVFKVLELETATEKIIKTVFYEEFHVRISLFRIRCYRSPKKEARVLDAVKGDPRFMQGYTCLDEKGNHVRIINFIKGRTFLDHVVGIRKSHEQYFHEDLPEILWRLKDSIEAIRFLHEHGTCHGDIRNDHIIIEASSGIYRWIDFDLTQDVSDFDVWSIGNIIGYAVAKGICSFHQVMKDETVPRKIRDSLNADDASAFYEYRIMNLRKLYPYIPSSLSDILLHFTPRPRAFYDSMAQLVDDYHEMLDREFPRG